MTSQDRIEELRAQHRSLEDSLVQETHRLSPNPGLVTDLKRQKLRIKDQILELEHPPH